MRWFFCCGTTHRSSIEMKADDAIRTLQAQKAVLMETYNRYNMEADELKKEALKLNAVRREGEARMKVVEYRRNKITSEIYLREWTKIDTQIAQIQNALAVNDALKLKEGAMPKLEALGITLNSFEQFSDDSADADENSDSNSDSESSSLRRQRSNQRQPLTADVRFKLIRENMEKFNETVARIQDNRNYINPAEEAASASTGAVLMDQSPSYERDMALLWEWENNTDFVPKTINLSPREIFMSVESDRTVDGRVSESTDGVENVPAHKHVSLGLSGEHHADSGSV